VYIFQRNNVKIISAIPGTSSMDKEEVNKFLESRILLQIGTIDEEGYPNIHPVWFSYDKDREKLLVITPKITKKVKTGKYGGVSFLQADETIATT
jgi:predicted pyridoxine 5'-phosphate oxidase superfamily flavin-nucleotide-binding protein